MAMHDTEPELSPARQGLRPPLDLLDLPPELLLHIIGFLPVKVLVSTVALTCRRMARLVDSRVRSSIVAWVGTDYDASDRQAVGLQFEARRPIDANPSKHRLRFSHFSASNSTSPLTSTTERGEAPEVVPGESWTPASAFTTFAHFVFDAERPTRAAPGEAPEWRPFLNVFWPPTERRIEPVAPGDAGASSGAESSAAVNVTEQFSAQRGHEGFDVASPPTDATNAAFSTLNTGHSTAGSPPRGRDRRKASEARFPTARYEFSVDEYDSFETWLLKLSLRRGRSRSANKDARDVSFSLWQTSVALETRVAEGLERMFKAWFSEREGSRASEDTERQSVREAAHDVESKEVEEDRPEGHLRTLEIDGPSCVVLIRCLAPPPRDDDRSADGGTNDGTSHPNPNDPLSANYPPPPPPSQKLAFECISVGVSAARLASVVEEEEARWEGGRATWRGPRATVLLWRGGF